MYTATLTIFNSIKKEKYSIEMISQTKYITGSSMLLPLSSSNILMFTDNAKTRHETKNVNKRKIIGRTKKNKISVTNDFLVGVFISFIFMLIFDMSSRFHWHSRTKFSYHRCSNSLTIVRIFMTDNSKHRFLFNALIIGILLLNTLSAVSVHLHKYWVNE